MNDATTEAGSKETREVDDPSENQNAGATAGNEGGTEEDSFLDAVRAPIREDAPAGEDVLYAENFQQLKAEVNKISSAGGSADYERITDLARTILIDQSKDLRAAGYLVIGAAREHGVEETAEAVRAVHVLIDEYWDELYPAASRTRSRGNALQFIGDRLPDWLQSVSFESEDRPFLETLVETLEDIQAFSMEELGEHAPSLSGLLHDLNDDLEDLPTPVPDEPQPEATASASGEVAAAVDESADVSPDSTSTGSTSTETEERPTATTVETDITSDTKAAQTVRTVAGYYREDDLSRPAPYQLMRAVRWGSLQSAPPNEGGTTRFDAPREQRRDYLKGLLEAGDYETLVREGESAFQGGTFHVWLDLQRLIVTALEALGESYRAARETVLLDLALLTDRVPSLLSLTFQDGTPFASAMTVDWIETEVQPQLGGSEAESGGASGGEELSEVEEDRDHAQKELKDGSLEGALSILMTEDGQEYSKKETFHRRLSAARLCVKGQKPAVARPILDALASVIEEHALDAWNPALALEVWTNRCQCYDRLAQEMDSEEESDSLQAEAEAAFEKICQVDPAYAVSVEKRRPVS